MNKNDYENNLDRIHEWIKSADQKVSIFIAFQGVILTLLFSDIFLWVKRVIQNLSFIEVLTITSGVVLIGFSIFKSISAIIPRLKNHKGRKSITYFNDIAGMDLKEYKKRLKETNDGEYEDELINQIHISAIISKKKHGEFRESIITFILGFSLLLLSFIASKVFYGN